MVLLVITDDKIIPTFESDSDIARKVITETVQFSHAIDLFRVIEENQIVIVVPTFDHL